MPYLKAKCEVEGQKASGLIGGGILAPNMTKSAAVLRNAGLCHGRVFWGC
jgi:hypothetical protein